MMWMCLFVVVVVAEVVFTRNSAFQEVDYSGVVMEKLFNDGFLSTGVVVIPPLAEKEDCATDLYDLVCTFCVLVLRPGIFFVFS